MQPRDWQVLIVEDEPDSLELIQTLLKHQGINSTGVGSAEEALAVLKVSTPTLLIIDLALPAMDGWGFLRRLQVEPSVRCVPKV
ncbi:MAG TPA: response regulator, partial [Aggregatilineales bacterium]|nr:response regulator [Aggregatilineales bacterium]